MDSALSFNTAERHSLVQNSSSGPVTRRSSLSVPLLDEESLKSASGTAGATTAATSTGGFTLVSQGDEGYKGGGMDSGNVGNGGGHVLSGLGKNFDQAQIYSMLQQQHAIAMAAAQLEQAYTQTTYMLQQCSQNALLTVLMSLLNDYPTTLVQPIRVRVEQVLAQQMTPSITSRGGSAPRKPGSNFVPNSSAAPWTPSNMQGSGAPTPTSTSTPSTHRRGRGHKNKEEEQEMCSLHNNKRAMKHLQLNPATGLYECIHGFHCLVDGPAEITPKRAAVTPPLSNGGVSRGSNRPPSADSQPFVPASMTQRAELRFSPSEMQALRMMGVSLSPPQNGRESGPVEPAFLYQQQQRGAYTAGSNSRNHHNGGVEGGGGFTVVGADRVSPGTSPIDMRLNMDMPSLEYLLQSVRDIDDE